MGKKDDDDTQLPATPAPPIERPAPERVIYVTEEQLQRKQRVEQKAAAKTKALEGLRFPLLVVATAAVVFYGGKRIRKGRTFTCLKADEYSASCMQPAPSGAVDQTAQAAAAAPKRGRRSGENGNPEAPAVPITREQAAAGAPKSVI